MSGVPGLDGGGFQAFVWSAALTEGMGEKRGASAGYVCWRIKDWQLVFLLEGVWIRVSFSLNGILCLSKMMIGDCDYTAREAGSTHDGTTKKMICATVILVDQEEEMWNLLAECEGRRIMVKSEE